MTRRILLALLAMLVALAAAPAFAQDNTGNVKGKALDEKGNPIVGATVRFTGPDGKKIEVKTDPNGEFEKAGIPGGKYKIQLVVGGNLRWAGEAAVAAGQENHLLIDMAAEAAAAKMTEEEKKQIEAQRQKQEAERSKIKNLNALLAQARQMETGGDYDGAIGVYQQAVQADASKDLLWANLGGAYLLKASKTSDKTQTVELAGKAAEALQKALTIKPNDAAYHNNLGQAYARANNTADALKEFTNAAQLDPTGAARYYFNAGAILTNESTKLPPGSDDQKKKLNDANDMFRKSMAADPKYSDGEANYQIGTNLLSQVSLAKDGSMVFPAGTAEAFQKYLDTSPNGRYAEIAKQNLSALGSKVETSYKKGGTKKK